MNLPIPYFVIGLTYIVTDAPKGGIFRRADCVRFNADGSVSNLNAAGWVDACDSEDALKGVSLRAPAPRKPAPPIRWDRLGEG